MIYTFLSFRIPYRFCGRSFNSLSRVKFMVGPSTWAKVSLMSINLKVHIELHDHVLINHSWSTPLFGQSWPLHVCSILHLAPLHLDVMVILYLPPIATVVTESQIIAKKWISLLFLFRFRDFRPTLPLPTWSCLRLADSVWHTRRCIGGASPAACCSGAQATPSRSRDGRDEHRWHLQPWQ